MEFDGSDFSGAFEPADSLFCLEEEAVGRDSAILSARRSPGIVLEALSFVSDAIGA